MKQLLLVFFGGGAGSLFRYLISKYSNTYFESFILGTFMVNIIGCLIMGYVLGLSFKSTFLNQNQAILLTTGFCGGFTTFSAFAAENYELFRNGDYLQLTIYILSSVVLGILAVALGIWLSRL